MIYPSSPFILQGCGISAVEARVILFITPLCIEFTIVPNCTKNAVFLFLQVLFLLLLTFASIPYLPGLTNKITSIFQDQRYIRVIKSMRHTFNTLVFSRLKDKEKSEYESKVVYSIPCEGCDRTYIGQTSNWIKTRITSHRSDARRDMKICSLTVHCNTNDHSMNYDGLKI